MTGKGIFTFCGTIHDGTSRDALRCDIGLFIGRISVAILAIPAKVGQPEKGQAG